MIKKIKALIHNPLFGGSAVMMIGSNFANAIAYFYHLIIGRLLGPSDYGELSAVLSVLGLLFTSFNFLGLVIVKFVSSTKESEVPVMFRWFTKKTYKIGIVIGLLIFLSSPIISSFLHIELKTALLIAPIVFIAFLVFIYRSFAQGLLKFWVVVVSTNIDMLLRLTVGVTFVYIGFAVIGATFGILIAVLMSLLYLKKYTFKDFKSPETNHEFSLGKEVFSYSIPVLFATLTLNSMFSTDVILVKHFFNSHDAGIYASLSTLGKIIFYGTGPVSAVMFPMISKRHSQKQGLGKVFFLSFFLTLAISSWISFLYFLFPDYAIKILFGDKYIEGASNLFYFGVFMSLFAISSLIFNFFLSIEKTKVVYISLAVSMMQIIGIVVWHGSIISVISVSIVSCFIFLIALLTYYYYYSRT
jgi:O-antigen/teichoic acid export membrane protein